MALVLCVSVWAQEASEGDGEVVVLPDNNKASVTIELGVEEVSLIKVQSLGPVQLVLSGNEAGLPLQTSVSDSINTKLLITSVISASERSLSAKILDGTPPPGTRLEVAVMPPKGNFVGPTGVSVGSKLLSNDQDENLLTGIATCYSGTGTEDGFPLKFTFSLDAVNYEAIRAIALAQVTVLFTLTAANNGGN